MAKIPEGFNPNAGSRTIPSWPLISGAPGDSHDRNVKLVLEKKEDIKKRLKRSPDDAEALFLTVAQKVMPKPAQPDCWRARLYEWAGEDAWMAR